MLQRGDSRECNKGTVYKGISRVIETRMDKWRSWASKSRKAPATHGPGGTEGGITGSQWELCLQERRQAWEMNTPSLCPLTPSHFLWVSPVGQTQLEAREQLHPRMQYMSSASHNWQPVSTCCVGTDAALSPGREGGRQWAEARSNFCHTTHSTWNSEESENSKFEPGLAGYHGCSRVAQIVKNLPAMQETWVWSCFRKIPWRRKWQPILVFLPGVNPTDLGAWRATVHGVSRVGWDWATNFWRLSG